MNLSESIAWVTGATRGVGRGVATALAAEGARVFVTGLSAEMQKNVTTAAQAKFTELGEA